MNIRAATEADEAVLRELWEEFEAEVPEPPGFAAETWEEEWADLRLGISSGTVLLAEDEAGPVGFLEARLEGAERVHVETVHVRPRARRAGIATALLRGLSSAVHGRGAKMATLSVLESNEVGRQVWARLGFQPVSRTLAQPLDALEALLEHASGGPSRASTHIQTDDRVSVERALSHFVPRLAQPGVRDAANGWIRIVDPVFDADRAAQSRLAGEVSDALGTVAVALAIEEGSVVRFKLYERGRMVDEYLSVPTFYGPLPKGDELALEANPTMVARLTGADREEVRRTARTAPTPAELPAAETLYEQIAGMMRLEP